MFLIKDINGRVRLSVKYNKIIDISIVGNILVVQTDSNENITLSFISDYHAIQAMSRLLFALDNKFVITYNSFPNWARSEVQAALDTWALNFKSSVDINVNATWSKSANDDVLGSARPGSYFANFNGAPDATPLNIKCVAGFPIIPPILSPKHKLYPTTTQTILTTPVATMLFIIVDIIFLRCTIPP